MKPCLIFLILKAVAYPASSCVSSTSTSAEFYRSLKATTTIFLSNSHRVISKNGVYSIPIKNNKTVKIGNNFNKASNDDKETLEYLGYANQMNGYLFLKKGYESYSYIFISNLGYTTEFRDYPFLSTGKNIIVVLSRGIENPMFPNSIQLFSFNNGKVAELCEVKVLKSEPENIRWVSNKTFILKSHKVTTDGLPLKSYVYTKFYIK